MIYEIATLPIKITDKKALSIFDKLSRNIVSLDVIMTKRSISIYGRDISTSTQYVYSSDFEDLKADYTEETKKPETKKPAYEVKQNEELDININFEDMGNIDLDDFDLDLDDFEINIEMDVDDSIPIEANWGENNTNNDNNSAFNQMKSLTSKAIKGEVPEENLDINLQQSTNKEIEAEIDIFEIKTTPEGTPITILEDDDIVRFRVERSFLDALTLFSEGYLYLKNEEIILRTDLSEIKFQKHKSAILKDTLSEHFDTVDYEFFNAKSLNSMIRALEMTEKEKYKQFLSIKDRKVTTYNDSIYLEMSTKAKISQKYDFNSDLLKILQKGSTIGDIFLRTRNDIMYIRLGKLLILAGFPEDLYRPNNTEGMNFSDAEKIFKVSKEVRAALNVIKKHSKDKTNILSISTFSQGIKLQTSDLVIIANTRAVEQKNIKIDMELLDVAIRATGSKEPDIGLYKLPTGVNVLVIIGEVLAVIPLEAK